MSDSNPSRYVAIGLGAILAVVLVAFSTYQCGAAVGVQSEIALQANNQAKHEYDRTHAKIEGCSQNIVVPEEQKACAAKASQESQKIIREIRDLESQQAMALWTRYMGIAAIIGITVGIIGTGLIFFTFWETRKGTRAAQVNSEAYIWNERGRLSFGEDKSGPTVIASGKPVRPRDPILENTGKSDLTLDSVSYAYVAVPNYDLAEGFKSFDISRMTILTRNNVQAKDIFAGDALDKCEYFMVGSITYRSLGKASFKSFFCLEVTRRVNGHDLDPAWISFRGCENLPPDT